MTPEQIELAQRLAAHPPFKWLSGMLAWRDDCPPVRVTHIEDAGNVLQEHRWRPDLTDPATLGCLLALVREAWRSPYAKVTCIIRAFRGEPPVWSCEVGPGPTFHAPTEGEALALAILSLP